MREKIAQRAMTLIIVAAIGTASALCSAAADDSSVQDGKDAADKLANAAAKFLQSVVDGMRVRLDGNGDNVPLNPRRSPLLTYSDPARGYIAAGMWRLVN